MSIRYGPKKRLQGDSPIFIGSDRIARKAGPYRRINDLRGKKTITAPNTATTTKYFCEYTNEEINQELVTSKTRGTKMQNFLYQKMKNASCEYDY